MGYDPSHFTSSTSPANYAHGADGAQLSPRKSRKRARAERRLDRKTRRYERRYGTQSPITHIPPEQPRFNPLATSPPPRGSTAHRTSFEPSPLPPPYEVGGFVHNPNPGA